MKRILLTLTLLTSLATFAADMVTPSLSASNTNPGQAATYTISYTAATANPNMAIYGYINETAGNFSWSVAGATVTINGTPASIDFANSWSGAQNFVVKLTNSALITVGANVVITIPATNPTTIGTYTWIFLRSADAGGNEIDGYRNPPSITIGTLSTIDSEVNKNAFNIYPNPASDILQIDTYNNLTINSLEIYNMYGANVKQFSPNVNNFKANVNDLPNGVYMLKINSNEKDTFIRKIVVRH